MNRSLLNRLSSSSCALLALVAPAVWGGSVPADRSLAPLDVEQVRDLYGQEALFRMRLGVEAAHDDGAACPGGPMAWSGSAQAEQLERQLQAGRPYAAGQILGTWQLWQQRCGGDSAAGGPAPAPSR